MIQISSSEFELEAGDIIFQEHYSNIQKVKIARVTNTMAVTQGGIKLKKIHSGEGIITQIAQERWNTIWYYPYSTEREIKFQRQNFKRKLDKIDSDTLNNLSVEEIKHITSLIWK